MGHLALRYDDSTARPDSFAVDAQLEEASSSADADNSGDNNRAVRLRSGDDRNRT